MSASVFTWTTESDPRDPKRIRYVLRNPEFPQGSLSRLGKDDRVGVCGHTGPRQWRSIVWYGLESVWREGGTAAAAMLRLEAELDRRSIGLFGRDDIDFVHAYRSA